MSDQIINQEIQEEAPKQQEIKKPKGKLELLTDIKKMIEKNGKDIDDDALLALFEQMTTKPSDIKQFTAKLEMGLQPVQDVQLIKIFPLKKVFIEKYNEYIDFNDKLFTDMIENFKNPTLFKPFGDKDHSLEEKYFDIVDLYKDYENKQFGAGLYAEIKLNALGVDAIKENKYSYISPEWGSRVNTDKELCKNVLWAVTLTNIPALEGELPKLQEQIKLTKGDNMDYKGQVAIFESQLKLSRKLENGTDVVPVASVMEFLSSVKEMISEFEAANVAQEEAVEEMQQELSKVNTELNTIKLTEAKKEKDEFFRIALETGKIEPKEKAILSAQYDKDKEFVKSYVELRDAQDDDVQLSANGENTSKLTAEDNAIIKDIFGEVTPETIKKYQKANGGN
jgi:phage I-like protein